MGFPNFDQTWAENRARRRGFSPVLLCLEHRTPPRQCIWRENADPEAERCQRKVALASGRTATCCQYHSVRYYDLRPEKKKALRAASQRAEAAAP